MEEIICLGQGLLDHGIGQVGPGGLGLRKIGLEAVAECHQYIDLGDDAVLF